MSRRCITRSISPLGLIVVFVALLALDACGGDTGTMTFRLANGTCFGCADASYTVTILRPSGSSVCKLTQSQSTSKRPTLEGLALRDGEAATVVIALSCPADRSCPICAAEKEIEATDGATYELELSPTMFCVVPALADPLIADCP